MLIDAEEPEERIGAVPEDEQVARLAHVAVVVDPLWVHVSLVQAQRRRHRRGRIPGSALPTLVRSDHPVTALRPGHSYGGSLPGRPPVLTDASVRVAL